MTKLPQLNELLSTDDLNALEQRANGTSPPPPLREVPDAEPDDGWPSFAARAPLPDFPVEALPPPFAAWVWAVAEHTQTPVALPALAGLGVLSAAALGSAVVDCGGWDEELGLDLLVAMPSGDRKSTVMRLAKLPLCELEKERRDEAAPRVQRERSRREVLEDRKRSLTRQAAKGDEEAEHELALVVEKLAEIGEPEIPRMLADDATPEALGGLLARHGSIAILAAESAFIDNIAGRYNDGKANLHLVCAAYSGEQTTIDRKGRDPEHLERPLLTIALTVQPHVLNALVSHPIARSQGLVARFAYALPETRLGERKVNTKPVSRDVAQGWRDIVRHVAGAADRTDAIRRSPETKASVSSVSTFSAVRIGLEPEAKQLLTRLQERIEPRLAPGQDLHDIADWATRHHGRVARIAALMHLAEHTAAVSIGESAMRNALAIGDYLLAHGIEALSGPDADTRRALRWLRHHGQAAVTVRDLHRGPLASRGSAEQAEALALALCDLGALRPRPPEARPGRGQPPSPAFDVNPRLLSSPALRIVEGPR